MGGQVRAHEGSPFGAQFRELRVHAGRTLAQIENTTHGKWKSVVVGSYERCDRDPGLWRADTLLREVYGMRLAIVPQGLSEDHLRLAALLTEQGVTAAELDMALAVVRMAREQIAEPPPLRAVA